VDPCAKINDIYYRDELLFKRFLPPAIRSTSRRYVTVQQDRAPAHRARDTLVLLAHETPKFIIIIITKIYIAHYRIAPNAQTVSVRSSE